MTGINYLLGELDRLRARGLVLDDACRTIVEEYSARRDAVERLGRFFEAIGTARDLADRYPHEAISQAGRARELAPDRPEGWVLGIDLLRKSMRFGEADRLTEEAAAKFPDLAWRKPAAQPAARVVRFLADPSAKATASIPALSPPMPKISWSGVAGEFLEEHWQKLISGLAVLLIVVSSTVGASLVLGPLLWSPIGKVVLALVFTGLCAGFGVGLARWGAERAGRMMLATSLIVIPINFMLLGELKLLAGASMAEALLVAVDAALLLALARGVIGALGFASAGTFTAAFFPLAAFNAGASPGMPFEAGFSVFLAPCAVFLGAVAWLNRRGKTPGEAPRADLAYLEFGLLVFAFALGVLRTGGLVLQLGPTLYAIPAMLAAIAGVSTARAIAPIEKDRRVTLLFQQGGLALSALAFALALASPPGPSSLYGGNILAVGLLGLALYATLLRATRLPAYLYCGVGALVVAYSASGLAPAVEEFARRAMGFDRKPPLPFKAIYGLALNLGLAWLSRSFAGRWSDDRLAWHCHAIGLPLSIAACVFSGFEPKAAVICLAGYAVLYSVGSWWFAEPRLVYLACSATAGAAFFGASLAGGATLGLRSLLASGLGLAFWLIRATPALERAGESYRIPLIRSARVMAALAMAAATLGAIEGGSIAPVATLAFFLTAVLALLNGRESPRVSIYFLAIAGLLGSWLGGFHYLMGGSPTSIMAHGLAVAGFSVAVVLAGEGVRHRLGTSRAAGAYLDAIGWAVPVLVLAAWALAGWSGIDSVTVARTFLVGSSALLWLTRFRREPVLVYLGLAGLTIWAACLCGLVVPGPGTGRLESGLAVTAALCSLAYWGVGEWVRRRGDSFYEGPCFLTAGALALGASVLAVDARWLSVDSYRVGVAAMLAGSATLGLIAWSRRWPMAVVLAGGQVVGASYLTILSQGPASPDSAWVLALLAALEAIACRGAGFLVRRFSKEPNSPLARPLDSWALALMLGALPLGLDSPSTLLAVAVASLLMIGCFPSNRWLYGTAFALGAAIYWRWLSRSSGDGIIPFVVLGAYASWGLAVALQRSGPRLLGRLGLADLGLHVPMVRVAVGLGLLAGAIRIGMVANTGAGWAALPWLGWVLALFCLLMLRFDPERGWVHLAVGLTGFGFAATLAPWVEPGGWWLSALMGLACSWWLAGRGADRFEGTCRRRLGIADGRDWVVLEGWSLSAFGLAGMALVAVVALATFAPSAGAMARWPDGLLALGLAGLYAVLVGYRSGRDVVLMGLEALGLLLAWWLAAPDSPLPALTRIASFDYLPLATAGYALLVVGLGRRAASGPAGGVVDLWEVPEWPRGAFLVEWTCWFGFGLGGISAYLSNWGGDRVELGTLLLATAATSLLALGWYRVESAIEGGILWCLAWGSGVALAARAMGLTGAISSPWVVALELVLGLSSLWWAAGWARRRGEGKGGDPSRSGRVASAMEWVAVAAAVPAGLLALTPAGLLAWFGVEGPAWLGWGVPLALAVFFAMVARRWSREWPVYVAQGFLLACYFRARPLIAHSDLADAVILSLLAYLDLGLSELMGRLRWSTFARPTFRFAMALPLVPILQGIWLGRWDEADLFVLLATAAFYALASSRLRSKTPAYAAAVLFNAFLWLAWYRLGWRMAEHPQFYLIPVGFTTILFGEVNRRELGRSVVNGARNLGLVLIYASLVAPIWQSQSFGAWLTLLLLSLLGIFAGIGLRVQSFLWLGLACFVLDVTYQLTRLGIDHVLARWGVMLTLGVALMLFVALNEKKRIVATLKGYFDEARGWE